MRFLVTGGTGMLGSSVLAALGERAVAVPRAALDLQDPAAVSALVAAHRPDVLVNCAAHVDAEAAEREPDLAVAANVLLPGLLATACRRAGALMVHVSSTGCYGDWKAEPYTEEDEPRPTTVHHASKLAGEQAVRERCPDHLILRTGWLFGGGPVHKKNFVWRRVLEACAAPPLRSDVDQRGNPTYTADLVAQALRLVEARASGTFNCVGEGPATRFAYVREILDAFGIDRAIEPVGAFPRLAPVSRNETAANRALTLLGLCIMPPWRESLRTYAADIRTWPEWHALQTGGARSGMDIA